jgi:hypothetical protein
MSVLAVLRRELEDVKALMSDPDLLSDTNRLFLEGRRSGLEVAVGLLEGSLRRVIPARPAAPMMNRPNGGAQ